MKKLLTYIGFSSLWVAACAYFLTFLTVMMLEGDMIPLLHPLLLLVFGGTLVIYNAHNLFKALTLAATERNTWNTHHKKSLLFWLLTGIVLTLPNLLHLHLSSILLLTALFILSVCYSYPLFPFKKQQRALKSYGILKPVLLSFVWVAVTFLLPVTELAIPLQQELVFKGLVRWLFMFILCVLFDVKDTRIDLSKDIRTLPVLLDQSLFKMLQTGASSMILLLFSAFIYFNFHSFYLVQGLAFLLLKKLIHQVQYTSNELFYVITIDGMMLVYSILLITCVVLT